MTMDRSDVVSLLNDMIETSRDGEQGFRTCAENAKSPQLKSFFLDGAQRCQQAVSELQQHVTQYGGSAETSGSVAGAVHRGWVNLKSALSTNEDKAMLEECVRGEEHAVSVYRDALQKDLPPELRTVVERMYQGAQQNHAKVQQLANQFQALT